MLHPALTRALANAHIEDLQRAAAQRHRLGLAEVPIVRSASTGLRGRRALQADGMTPTEISHAALVGMPIRRRRPLIAGVKPREGQAGVRRT
jgi:hypothetical protein